MHFMLVHVNNQDDSRLVPEREKRGEGFCRGHEVEYYQKSFQTLEPFTYYLHQTPGGAWFVIFGCHCRFINNVRDQYRAAEVFERILHIIQILLESDLLCDRCTVKTAAA